MLAQGRGASFDLCTHSSSYGSDLNNGIPCSGLSVIEGFVFRGLEGRGWSQNDSTRTKCSYEEILKLIIKK